MSEQPPEEPGPALEPGTLPEQPLTAERAAALLAKDIGLPRPADARERVSSAGAAA